ncbi:MAG: hypothetical protein WBG93_15065, partial [Thermoanaerobaculia bacterium]
MTGGVLRGKLEVNATDTVIVAPAQWEEPIRADTLDAAGNRTNEKLEILAGGWETKSDTDFVYSTRCELDQIIRAPGTEDESVTEYDYDCNGNLERVWDANNPSGGKVNQASQFYVYDDLNRLFSITQPWTGMGGDAVTSYGYDVQDHLTSLTDAEGNTTTYVYSDRGLMTFQDSPVSGDTTFAYNEHGELISQTDGRGITVNRGTDALDRVTTVTYPTQSELDTTYTYDDPGAPFSVGRLTKIERGASAVSYAYDRFGRLTQDGDLGYGYDDNGNRSEITYPGGVVATYSHDFADRPETLTVDDGVNPPPHRNVVTAATYLPSGPLSDLTLGNGINETRVFDSRYFPESIATSGLDERTWSYFTDDVGNITRIDWTRQCIDQVVLTDTTLEGAATFIACSELRAGPAVDVVPPGDVTFLAGSKVFLRDGFRLQGDAELHVRIDPGVVTPELSTLTYAYQPHQYFLTDAYGPWGDLEWTYDRIGNRLTETRDGMEDNYTYSPAGSPILASIALAVGGTRNYNYGPGGSLEDVTAGENQIGFSTDAEGRLSALERPAASEQVAFDYDGRSFLDRVERPLAAPDLGWLEPLYSSDGTLQGLKRQPVPTDPVEETFFFTFSGRPVAQLKQVDGTNTWTFFTTDHLGTPMVASDLAG